MAWYYGTFSCGCEGRVNVIGPQKDRQWKIDRAFSKMCSDCYEKYITEQREKANKEAAQKAKEMDLPELTGTEKQVAWANTLRQKLIDLFSKIDEEELEDAIKYDYEKLKGVTLKDTQLILDYILVNKTEAKYYIDNRYNNAFEFMEREVKEALKTEEEKMQEKFEKQMENDIKLELTIFPEDVVTNVAAEIFIKEDNVSVKFEKNDDFIKIVKGLGFKWNGIWKKNINELTGTSEDRAIELGNKLLNEGFPVIIEPKLREKVINGEYEQECDRWIMIRKSGEYEGWFAIKWFDGRNNKLYNTARKLPGSRWDKGSVLVRIEHFEEVEEFAQLYGFEFTKAAKKAKAEYKEKLSNIETVNPVKVEEIQQKDGLEEILNSKPEILPDLIDED